MNIFQKRYRLINNEDYNNHNHNNDDSNDDSVDTNRYNSIWDANSCQNATTRKRVLT